MSDGVQQGPVTADEFGGAAAAGMIGPESQVWTEGLEEWISAAQVEGLVFGQPENSENPVAPAAAATVQQAVQSVGQPFAGSMVSPVPASGLQVGPGPGLPEMRLGAQPKFYGGIGRVFYFGTAVLVFLIVFGAAVMSGSQQAVQSGSLPLANIGFLVAVLVGALVIIFMRVMRLENMGMSGWWVLLSFVPLVGILMNWLFLACPRGFADQRRLDVGGWITTVLLVLGLPVLFFFVMGTLLAGSLNDSKLEQQVEVKMREIAVNLEAYRVMTGRYPTSDQGLQALITDPSAESAESNWLQLLREMPIDPWGEEYVYRGVGADGYELISCGEDRKHGTLDDLTYTDFLIDEAFDDL